MYPGGPHYSQRAAQLIRYAGLLVPIILISYGLLGELGIVTTGRSIPIVGFWLLNVWWLLLAVMQFAYTSRSRYDSALRLAGYHLLGAAYLFFIIGIATPFAAFWIILVLASWVYFGKIGVYLSTLWFTAVVFIDIFFWATIGHTIAVNDLVALVAVLLGSIVTLGVGLTPKRAIKSAHKRETLQHDRMITVINNLSDAIISTDRHGIIKLYNAASLNLLDTNVDIKEKTIDQILPLTDEQNNPVKISELLKSAKSSQTRDDLVYSFSEGDTMTLEVTYSPIRSGSSGEKEAAGHEGYILIMRDVTKAKSLAEERDEFISVVSHELRTPIAITEGSLSNVQLMLKQGTKVTQKALAETVDAAHDQIIYLAKMVNDLSTLSRAERGVADAPEEIDVRELMHKMFDAYHDEAKSRKLHFNLDLSPTLGSVSTSRLYLEELLQNFITNALKYTKEGSVTVSAEQKAGVVTFAVKDTGIGISKSDQQKIFQKFFRSEDYRTRETNGTGLGLYVARKLASKIGTRIDFTSRLNHGSTFSFSLPVIKK